MNIEDDIDFLLSHFNQTSIFPRRMMTKTSNYQFSINSKDELIRECIGSELIDCRINAYPEYAKWEKYDLVRYPPDFIFIDLDLSNFAKYKNPKRMLDLSLRNTINKISVTFSQEHSHHSQHSSRGKIQQPNDGIINEVKPTVLWSGNGYHIYLPIQALILDDFDPFSKDKFPSLFSPYICKYNGYSVSEVFLLFAKLYLTEGKADPQHRPNYKTCLIRIPNTHNSKCLNKGLSLDESRVKVIQEWNGYRPPIQLLTKEFWKWLIQEEINQRIKTRSIKNGQINNYRQSNDFQIKWIEKLLQSGIPDGRKEALRLVLGPYLGKRKRYDESVALLENWLDKCNKLRPLDRDFNSRQKIQIALINNKGFLILENLKIRYRWLYDTINANRMM